MTIRLRYLVSVLVLCVSFMSCVSRASASTTTLVPTGGSDATAGTVALSASDVAKLTTSDDVRVADNGDWTVGQTYDENAYLEFTFTPTIADGATVTSVSVDNEFRRTGAMNAAKLEIWNGTQFVDVPLTTGTINVDHTDTVDISSIITTLAQVRSLKIRFLAYRDTQGSTKTSHDYVGVNVQYTDALKTNTLPVATDTSTAQTVDDPILLILSASDVDNDPLTYSVVVKPTKGVLGAFVNNHVTYTPSGVTGIDTFTYKVNDGKGDSNIATVTITLSPGATSSLVVSPAAIVLPVNETDLLTITSKDKFGNFTTGDNTTVITTSAMQGGVLANTTFTLKAGTATDSASATSSGVISFNFYGTGTNPIGFTTLAFTPIPKPLGGSGTTTTHIACASAIDMTGTAVTLRPFADIPFIAVEDTLNYASAHPWPFGAYNENSYIECVGDANKIPSTATVDAVLLKHTFARPSFVVVAAKLEVWSGTSFVSFPLTPPSPSSATLSQTIDITNILSTPSLLNAPRIRLLMYGTDINNSISIATDMLGLDVLYHTATSPSSTSVSTTTPTTTTTIPATTPATTTTTTPQTTTTTSSTTTPASTTTTPTSSTQATTSVTTPTTTTPNVVTQATTPIVASTTSIVHQAGHPIASDTMTQTTMQSTGSVATSSQVVDSSVATIADTTPVQTATQVLDTKTVPKDVTQSPQVVAMATPLTAKQDTIPLAAYAGGTSTFIKGGGYLLAGLLFGLAMLRLYGFLYTKEDENEEDGQEEIREI